MIWPFKKKTEKRSSGGYTSASQRIAEIMAAATGSGVVTAAASDALETASSYYGLAFAAAAVNASPRAKMVLGPRVLESIARDLITGGESVWEIGIMNGRLRIIRSSYCVVYGDSPLEETWTYQLNLPSPSGGLKTRFVMAPDVIHTRYSTDSKKPWCGLGPLQRAIQSGKLLSALENLLTQETAAASGYVLALASGTLGEEAAEEKIGAIDAIVGGIKAAKGGTVGIELSTEPMDLTHMKTAKPGLDVTRIGADFPQAVAELREPVRLSVLACCGIPAAFSTSQTSTNWRESFRSFVFARVMPLSEIIAEELSVKLDERISFDFDALSAADVQGRSRAYKSLIDGGMNAAHAAMICGFSRGEKE